MKSKFKASLMCMDFLDMKNQLEILDEKCDGHHVDIMDGHFCKNITLSPDFIKACAKVCKKPIDVHLMTTNPLDWIELCAKAGANIISPHAETINTNAFRTLNLIKSLGCKTGVTVNPATTLESIRHYLGKIDVLTIMSVDVGYAGQPFIEEMLEKIAQAKKLRAENGYTYEIMIDGCCNEKTFKKLHEAGADTYILGSSCLFGLHDDLSIACDMAKEKFNDAINAVLV